MKKNILIAALWIISILASCITTAFILKKNRLAIIDEAKKIAERPNFSGADMTIFYVDHGEGREQIAWMEGARDSNELAKTKILLSAKDEKFKTLAVLAQDQVALTNTAIAAAELFKSQCDSLEAQLAAMKAQNTVESKVEERPPNYGSSVPQDAPNNGSKLTIVEKIDQPAPNWQIPTRNQALATVKKNAATEWGNNFSMVNHEIDRQMESYDKLVQYQKQSWKPLMRTLVNEAGEKWPNSFTMMVYEIERQIEAKDKLNNK